MQFVKQERVLPEINKQSEREIKAVNDYIDRIKGTVVSVEIIHAGQPRPYADSVYEALIFCHQPNSKTTNAPIVRTIDIEEAKAIARIFVHDFDDTPVDWAAPKLEFIRPVDNPCGIEGYASQERHSCWRVRITQAFTD